MTIFKNHFKSHRSKLFFWTFLDCSYENSNLVMPTSLTMTILNKLYFEVKICDLRITRKKQSWVGGYESLSAYRLLPYVFVISALNTVHVSGTWWRSRFHGCNDECVTWPIISELSNYDLVREKVVYRCKVCIGIIKLFHATIFFNNIILQKWKIKQKRAFRRTIPNSRSEMLSNKLQF